MSSSAKIRAGLCADVWIPSWLYSAWPWLCLTMALVYCGLTWEPIITTGLITYAGWTWIQRLSSGLAILGDDYEL